MITDVVPLLHIVKYGYLLSDGRMDVGRLLQRSEVWKYLKEKKPSPLKESESLDCEDIFFPEKYGYAVGIVQGECILIG